MYPTTPMFRVSVTAWVGAGRVRVSYVLYLTANDDLTLLLAYLHSLQSKTMRDGDNEMAG